MVSWRDTLAYQPELRQVERWPPVSLDHLDARQMAVYRKRFRAIAMVLDGQTLRAAARDAGMSPGQLSKVLRRCLGTDPACPFPMLSIGLVPGARICTPTQAAEPGRIKSGAGAFARLLAKYPQIQQSLDRLIVDDLRNRESAERLTPKSFHGKLKKLLQQANVRTDEYPFTTHLCGREACRQYFHRRRRELDPSPVRRISRPDQGWPRKLPIELYNRVQIDEHTLDAHSSARLEIDVGGILKHLRIPRFLLALAVDYQSNAIIGATFDFAQQPTEIAMLRCLDSIENGSGASGFDAFVDTPTGFLPQDEYAQLRAIPGEIQVDNALAHDAHHVLRIIGNRWMSTYNFGLPAVPLARQMVERLFRKVAQEIHRYRSTSGVSVTDPNRESKSLKRKPPKITVQRLLEHLVSLIRAHNSGQAPHLHNRTPTQVLIDLVAHGALKRELVIDSDIPSIWLKRVPCTVRYYGGGQGRINLLNVQYTGPALTPEWANKPVIAEYDIRDVRSARIFSQTGVVLGELRAPKAWCHHAHTERERAKLFKDHRALVAHSDDPIGEIYENSAAMGGKRALKALRLIGASGTEPTSGTRSVFPAQPSKVSSRRKLRFHLKDVRDERRKRDAYR